MLSQKIDVTNLGDLTFGPDYDWSDNTSFTWKGSDRNESSVPSANVNVQINPINDLPVVTTASGSVFMTIAMLAFLILYI